MHKIFSALRIRSLLLAAFGSVIMALPSAADTIPAPVIEVNGGVGDFGTFANTGSTITLSSSPNPSIAAVTSGNGGTEGFIQYFVVLTGGQFGDQVPLTVTGSLSTSASGGGPGDVINSDASIGLTFFDGNYGATESVFCGNVERGEDCSDPTWSGSLSAIAVEGYDNTIAIFTSTEVSGVGTATAYADPYVYIDPGFLADHPEYSLELNVGNTASSTPEPSTLLLAPGCLLGLFLARKKLAF
jgi:hypothetical protein